MTINKAIITINYNLKFKLKLARRWKITGKSMELKISLLPLARVVMAVKLFGRQRIEGDNRKLGCQVKIIIL